MVSLLELSRQRLYSYQVFFIDFNCNLKFTLLISGVTAQEVVIKFHLTYTYMLQKLQYVCFVYILLPALGQKRGLDFMFENQKLNPTHFQMV